MSRACSKYVDKETNYIFKLAPIEESIKIVTIDSRTDYYDVSIKDWRLEEIKKEAAKHPESSFEFILGDISDSALINKVFADYHPDIVVNLAAQAGVRYSITNPDAYI